MFTRVVVFLALCGCAQAQRHPAIAVGLVAGVVGGMTCEIQGPEHQSTCGIIGGAAGLGLGLITGLVTLIFDTSDHSLGPDDDEEQLTPEGALKVHTHTEPPPVPIDAGVDAAPMDAVVSPDA